MKVVYGFVDFVYCRAEFFGRQSIIPPKFVLEIIKVLYRGANILVLDEPTAVLTPQETEKLFTVLRNMKKDGKAIVIITHKLNEVMELSDSLIVMHGGKIAAYFEDTSTLTDDVMGEYMLGLKHQSDEKIRRVCHD